ncbi:MAG: hypothetical protein QXG18_02845 [Candidatus Pacearchaeota archaeon]
MLSLNKKADSLVISYVLLVSIGLIVATMAYGWLKSESDITEHGSCPKGLSIFISDYRVNNPLSVFNLSLKNNGRYKIEGFFVRINNETDFETGIYDLGRKNILLMPGDEIKLVFSSKENIQNYKRICFIEVQPFISNLKGEMILCSQMATKKLVC